VSECVSECVCEWRVRRVRQGHVILIEDRCCSLELAAVAAGPGRPVSV
jgi:hypothetical protein